MVFLPVNETQFQDALDDICAISGDYNIIGYASTVPGLTVGMLEGEPLSLINYLAARLDKLDDAAIEKLTALTESDMRPHDIGDYIGCIRDEGCFIFLPGILTDLDLGHYYLFESGLAKMPLVWKESINLIVFGMSAAELEKGAFTSRGYIAQLTDKKRKKTVTAECVPARYRLPEPAIDFTAIDTEGADL